MKWRFVVPLVVLASLIGPSAARAQYFGQNKVQYEQFDFKVLKTEHFDIYFYPEEKAAVELAARMAERWYSRLSKVLAHELNGRQTLILYAAHPHFQQTNVLGGEIGEGTGGVTESARRRIILPLAGGLAESDHVLGHELVHAFQYDIASSRAQNGSNSAMAAIPLWFIEGMAEYLSLGPVDAQTSMWVRDAAAREKMPTLKQLDDPSFFPYRYGHAFWAYVAATWGDKAIGDMLYAATTGLPANDVIQTVLNVDDDQFTEMWHDATKKAYSPYYQTTQPGSGFGRSLLAPDKNAGRMNLAPAISPDGKRVVFLSERSDFAIDMYVADVATGKVLRQLVKTEGDPHFESLQFIESAGDWAPDNRRFVFSALVKGRPVLAVMDVDTAKREAEYPFPDLDQIFNPSFSPDGTRIAFTAQHGGLLDLYIYDLTMRQTTQLTSDPFADYDPEWTPDGKSLAWVTDRFGTNTETLTYGNYRIGLIDITTKEAKQLAGFSTGTNSNPEFSQDGKSLFFVGTPDGIANVYRMNVADGTSVQVTNVLSGVNGITPLTPALTVAAKTDTLVFTVFEDNEYNLYATDHASNASTPGAGVARSAAILPPGSNRPMSEVLAYLQAPTAGLPPPTEFPEEAYKPKLALDDIVQPSAGVGVDRFGVYAAGGLSMVFSDTLGNHQLGATLLLTNRLEEIGGVATYLNKSHRWNWGVTGGVTPYVSGGYNEFVTTVNGTPVVAQEEIRATQSEKSVNGLLQYPFNRAYRVELNGGYRNISYTTKVTTRLYSFQTGQQINELEEDVDSPASLSLGEAGAALVYDTAITGATSPIMGQRYRMEYTQSAGTLTYSGVLADYRKYLMPVRPFTIALRGMHYGRYGRDSNDSRLSVIDLGNPGLVRGYDFGSFEAEECLGVGFTCPVADQLLGSRIAVVNAELRFPLLGVFTGRNYYGPLPLEVAVFTDAGTAWDNTVEPRFLGGDRDWVRSVGAGLRFNLLGFLVGEMDYVKPLDRPEKGWFWQFNFVPGF